MDKNVYLRQHHCHIVNSHILAPPPRKSAKFHQADKVTVPDVGGALEGQKESSPGQAKRSPGFGQSIECALEGRQTSLPPFQGS